MRLHAPSRRDLLLGSGTLFAWAHMPKLAQAEGRDPRFLTIILRGALDGLATVAPVGDPDWLTLRAGNALTLDGKTPARKLDDFFALHPAMPNLHGMLTAKEAIVVHASATPHRDRSHFDGQDLLESGLPKPGASESGWLSRALAGLAPAGRVEPRSSRVFAVGPVTPLVVRGLAPVLSWSPQRVMPVSEDTVQRLFALYRDCDAKLAGVVEDNSKLAPAMTQPGTAQRPGAAVGALALDGWDTHINEGIAQGNCLARSTRRWPRSRPIWARPGARLWLCSPLNSAARPAATAPTTALPRSRFWSVAPSKAAA